MSKIRFGVHLPYFPDDDSKGQEHVQNNKKYLDSLDNIYESVWVCDHLIPDKEPYNRDTLECLTTISYYLPQYPNQKFGSLVLGNNYRNPALLAKMSSTLQTLSNGRFILGIGAGWYQEEYKQYGYRFPSPRTRVQQLEEAVQIIRMMWTEDDVTFHGKHYSIENTYCNPKPDPLPPIVIGGWGEKYTLRVVAKYADWWNGGYLDVETWTHKMNVIAGYCDDVGRDFDEIVMSSVYGVGIADTDAEALQVAKSTPHSLEYGLIGSPETLVSKFGEWIDVGVEYFQLYFPLITDAKATQRFADEVIPELI